MLTAPPAQRSESTPARDGVAADAPYDETLFDELRALRKTLADERDVPAYVIFPDTTLRAMARDVPADATALRRIPGVGDRKLADYGDAFLAALAAYRARENPGAGA